MIGAWCGDRPLAVRLDVAGPAPPVERVAVAEVGAVTHPARVGRGRAPPRPGDTTITSVALERADPAVDVRRQPLRRSCSPASTRPRTRLQLAADLRRVATYSATERIWAPCSSAKSAFDCRMLSTPTAASRTAITTSCSSSTLAARVSSPPPADRLRRVLISCDHNVHNLLCVRKSDGRHRWQTCWHGSSVTPVTTTNSKSPGGSPCTRVARHAPAASWSCSSPRWLSSASPAAAESPAARTTRTTAGCG